MTVAIHLRTKALDWSFGAGARAYIEQNGFHVEAIDLLLGASGGPKWLVLAGLDRALFGSFFAHRQRPLPTLASSIGSWRFACLAQKQPLLALDRFLEAYLDQQYPNKVTVHDVSRVLDSVLSHLLGETGVSEILTHPFFRNHIVTIRSGAALRSDNRALLACGLAATFLANLTTRGNLGMFCERAVFGDSRAEILTFGETLSTRYIALSEDNLELALRASGAVPLVLAGVSHIPGAPKGVYRDGGVTDYHFEQSVGGQTQAQGGLIFYPHFYNHCIPGWFDKALKGRHQAPADWDRLVMVSPSEEFVAKLPGGRIPDRKDFFSMDNDQRLAFWQRTVQESERLGDAFLEAVARQQWDVAI